jgi:hypothetical protein
MLPPNLRPVIKQIEQAINKSESGADDRSKRAEESQKNIAVAINSLSANFSTYLTKQDDSERKKSRRENITIGSLVVTAVVTIALAYIACLQTGISDRTDKTLHNTLVEANRAWLAPSHLEFIKAIDVADGPVVSVHFRNVGHSPGLNLKNSSGWLPIKITKASENGFPEVFPTWEQIGATIRTSCEQNKPTPDGQSVFPDEIREGNMIATAPKDAADKSGITNGSEAIIVTGCLTYNSFDEVRHTGFCRYASKIRSGQWEFLSCPAGNFAN